MHPALRAFAGAVSPHRLASHRVAWHALGLLAAGLLAWLIVRAYRDPALILDIANWRLC